MSFAKHQARCPFFEIIIKPTTSQLQRIPKWNHTQPVDEVLKPYTCINHAALADDDDAKVRVNMAQDETFLYLRLHKKDIVSMCKKDANVKYCKPWFNPRFYACTNEEIEDFNKRHSEEVEAAEKATEFIGIDELSFNPKTKQFENGHIVS